MKGLIRLGLSSFSHTSAEKSTLASQPRQDFFQVASEKKNVTKKDGETLGFREGCEIGTNEGGKRPIYGNSSPRKKNEKSAYVGITITKSCRLLIFLWISYVL